MTITITVQIKDITMKITGPVDQVMPLLRWFAAGFTPPTIADLQLIFGPES
jgi:hypothetical protein